VVPSYCSENTLAARLQAGGDSGEGIDIRCTLLNMSFSAHADARGITRTVCRFNSRAVMLVHGNEAKIKAFQPLLREALGGSIPIYAPANLTELDLPTVLQSSGAANPRWAGSKRKQSLAENPDDAIINKNSNCFYNASDPANSVGRLIEEDGDDENDDVQIDALDADWHLAIERYKRAGQ
jgi:Zn-dependent metallo-hydrolase RNA specificity domain